MHGEARFNWIYTHSLWNLFYIFYGCFNLSVEWKHMNQMLQWDNIIIDLCACVFLLVYIGGLLPEHFPKSPFHTPPLHMISHCTLLVLQVINARSRCLFTNPSTGGIGSGQPYAVQHSKAKQSLCFHRANWSKRRQTETSTAKTSKNVQIRSRLWN